MLASSAWMACWRTGFAFMAAWSTGSAVVPDRGDIVIDLNRAIVLRAHQRARPSRAQLVPAAQMAAHVRQRARVDRRFPAAFGHRPAARRRAAGNAGGSRLGRRSQEPPVRRDHRLPSQPAASAAAVGAFPCGSCGIRSQSFPSDRWGGVAAVVPADSRELAVDGPRGRGRRRRGGAGRSRR